MRCIDPSKNRASGDWRVMSNPAPPCNHTLLHPSDHLGCAPLPPTAHGNDYQHIFSNSLPWFRTGTETWVQIHTSCVLEFHLSSNECGQFKLEAQPLERWWLIAWELGGGLLNETWRSVCVYVTDRWMGLWVYLGLLSFIFPLLFDLTCYLLLPFFTVIHTLTLLQMLPQIFEWISADVTEKHVCALWELSSSHLKRWPCAGL